MLPGGVPSSSHLTIGSQASLFQHADCGEWVGEVRTMPESGPFHAEIAADLDQIQQQVGSPSSLLRGERLESVYVSGMAATFPHGVANVTTDPVEGHRNKLKGLFGPLLLEHRFPLVRPTRTNETSWIPRSVEHPGNSNIYIEDN